MIILPKMKMFADNLGTFEHPILDEDTMLHVLVSVELEYDSNTMLDTWQEARALQESHRSNEYCSNIGSFKCLIMLTVL